MEPNEKEQKIIEELSEIFIEEGRAKNENPKKELEKLVSENLFGKGVSSKRVNVRWNGLFNKNLCPACDEKIEKKDQEYVCAKCGLRIPVDLYNKAKEQNAKENEREEKEFKLREKMSGMKLNQEKIDSIYEIAMERAEKTLETPEKKNES